MTDAPAGAARLALRALSARHVAAREGAPAALREVDLVVAPGEALALIGPSGAGKTTLLHVAAAALPPTAGALALEGLDPWQQGAAALKAHRTRLFLAPQVPPLPPRQRVVTAVLAGRLPAWGLWASLKSLFYPSDIAAAHEALARFDLAEKLFERVDRLSGGERQRVGLARALLAPASLWLLDEPLAALDPTRARQALATLVNLARERGITLVTTMHQVEMALAHFPRIVGLRDGRIQFDLPAAEVSRDRLAALYAQHEHEWLAAPAPHASPVQRPEAATQREAIAARCR
jgi:phosphonate transport system ATP-binding protein